MIAISTRSLVSLASASALIATMAVAAVPASAMASACAPTGFIRDGIDLTAAQIDGSVTGELDATGCDIAVYNPTSVTNADVHGARYFGVVVNGEANVNTTNSTVREIGENPFNGTQHGRAILYINGASGTISGNDIYDFQKNGIEISGLNAAGDGPSSDTTSATVKNNVVTGEGHIDYIAQNGIVIRDGANAIVSNNAVSHVWYTPDTNEATGLLNFNAGSVKVSGNTFVDTETRIYGEVIADAQGASTTTVRLHGVRVDLRSDPKPAPLAVLGAKLDWKVKVDGGVKLHIKQGFGDHAVYRQHFTTGSGRHVIKVLKNNVVVQRTVVRF